MRLRDSRRLRYLLGGCWMGHDWIRGVRKTESEVSGFMQCATCGLEDKMRPVFTAR